MSRPDTPHPPGRLPPWLKKRLPRGGRDVRDLLSDLDLATVCAEAHCPNQGECYACGTATFLILGTVCTRNCGFCAVCSGHAGSLREDEPEAVATAAARMKLRHVVVTSVTRDDLPDGGAGHFARTIDAIRREVPDAAVEVLVPDFLGRWDDLDTVLAARPDVLNHNVETVPRLYAAVRPAADYRRSLDLLARAASAEGVHTKSGLMLGLGETDEEIPGVLADLREAGCEILTLGQYLAPSPDHVPVDRFVRPEAFDAWGERARSMGFAAVASGPFVRSSYHARDAFEAARGEGA